MTRLPQMFLLTPSVFGWDLLLLTAMTTSFALAVLCFARLRTHKRWRWWAKLPFRLMGGVLALACLAVMYGTFIEPQMIVVSQYEVPFPSSTPLKIALISDLHVGPYKDAAFVRRLVDETNDELPDLILIAGDFLFDEQSPLTDLAPLADLSAPLGVFAVSGNHDVGRFLQIDLATPLKRGDRSDDLTRALESLGIQVLRNENVTVRSGSMRIAIAGVDDIWSDHSNLDQAIAGVPETIPLILLAHQPDIALDTLSTRADLIVAGHTHGGQLRLPWYGSLAPIPSKMGRKYDQGVFTIGNTTTLAITRGAGESLLRTRLFAWPQVMILRTVPRD